jgi:2-methylisocitrate lyase-like PEP mutase family enzyme
MKGVTMKKKSTILRELINRGETLLRPLVAIPLHAQMAEALGYQVVGISGAYTAAHILGLPDAGLITMTEMVENVRRICNAVNIPVIADGDTGFGNAINVRRTVQSMIQAGAACMFMEDQVAPKRCGFVAGKEIIPIEEAIGKFQAAIDVRNELDSDFIIMARTDARTAVGGSLEETIRRARAYQEIGADIIYVEAVQSREEVKQIRASVKGPLACSAWAMKPYPTLKEMQELGLCMTLGVMFFEAGLAADWDMLVAMKEKGLEYWYDWRDRAKDHPASWKKIYDLVGFPKVREWEGKYLSGEQMDKYEKSPGLYQPR